MLKGFHSKSGGARASDGLGLVLARAPEKLLQRNRFGEQKMDGRMDEEWLMDGWRDEWLEGGREGWVGGRMME